MSKATRAVGLGGTSIHNLRHTATSLLIASGADVKVVQSILGHATATMKMDLYGHLLSEAPSRAMAGDGGVRGSKAAHGLACCAKRGTWVTSLAQTGTAADGCVRVAASDPISR